MTATGRILLVGEAPGPRGTGVPLAGRVGARLEALAGIPEGTLRERFDCVNLLPTWPGRSGKASAFPAERTRGAAERLTALLAAEPAHGRVIFLGSRVARAFGRAGLEPCYWHATMFGKRAVDVALLPHPSGVNRWWNDSLNAAIARRFLRNALKENR